MTEKVVIVHSLDQARAAVAAAARLDLPVTLASAPGASAYLGIRGFQAIVDAAAREHPDVRVSALIDCGERAGDALASLHCGFQALRYSGNREAATRLAAIAAQQDATLVTGRLEALDLLDVDDPEGATLAWLAP